MIHRRLLWHLLVTISKHVVRQLWNIRIREKTESFEAFDQELENLVPIIYNLNEDMNLH